MVIDLAVGLGAQNLPADVARVRELLAVATGAQDAAPGQRGPAAGFAAAPDLGHALRRFQAHVLRDPGANGRMAPGSETEAMLIAVARQRVWMGARSCREFRDPRLTAALIAPLPRVGRAVERSELISPRTLAVLQMLGHCCGLGQITITEGIRTYERMARYFLDGTTDGKSGVRGRCWLYARTGILDPHNGGKPWPKGKVPAEHVADLARYMREQSELAGTRISNHVVSDEQYRSCNVIDLGYNSNPLLKEHRRARQFARLLDLFHVRNPQARYQFVRTWHPPHELNDVLGRDFLGVQLKVENAWHIEILPTAVPADLV